MNGIFTYYCGAMLGFTSVCGNFYVVDKSARSSKLSAFRIVIALLLLTTAKIYFIDLRETAGITRVIVLLIFGAVLLGFNFVDRQMHANLKKKENS